MQKAGIIMNHSAPGQLNFMSILERTLNYVDPRLSNHGMRVAHIVYKVLCSRKDIDRKQLRSLCVLAMLHDVGAYKIEEIDKMMEFETFRVWEHSVYGYLFIKYFSPLSELAPIVLYHHADVEEVKHADPAYQEFAQIFSLADKVDLHSLKGISNWKDFTARFNKYIGTKVTKQIVDMFFYSEHPLKKEDFNGSFDPDFVELLDSSNFDNDEINDFLKMIILSIDFRSTQTVTHTFVLVEVSRYLGELLGYSQAKINDLCTAALVHDIGKVGIPTEILESPNRLTDEEMQTMKKHVTLSDEILKGNISDYIRHIAIRHHEKLDGSGYPDGLNADDLSQEERLMAIADIFSALCGVRTYKDAFPKEKIISILTSMSDSGQLDSELTALAVKHFDTLSERVSSVSTPLVNTYQDIWAQYNELCQTLKNLKGEIA